MIELPNHCQLRFPQATRKKEKITCALASTTHWGCSTRHPTAGRLESHQDPSTARPLCCLQDLLRRCCQLESKQGRDPLPALDSPWPRTHTDPSREGGCKGWRAGLPEEAWLHRVEHRGSLLLGVRTRQGGCGIYCLEAGEMGIGWGCGRF